MANILTQEDENNKNQQTSAPMGQSDSITSTGGGPSTAQNPAAQSVQPKPQGSGRFTNLQKYLGANQKAGENLAGGIRQKGGEYMGKVREGVESAKNVQQGIQGEKARIGQAGQLAQNIQDDAVSVAQNNLQDVTQLRLGQNQATQLQGTGQQAMQNLNQNINPLQQFGQNLGTESGRFQVLQDTFGGAYRPNYNMGQRRLDQLFLQADGSDQLDQLGSEIGQTVTSADQSRRQLAEGLGQGIQDIRGGAAQAQRDVLGAIGAFDPDGRGAFGSLYGDLTSEVGVRKGELQENLERARSQFGRGELSQDVADMLGLTGGTNFGVMDLGQYAGENINLGDTDVRMADVVDRADYQDRLDALASLSGTNIEDYTGTDQFGVKEGSEIGFDAGKWQSDAARHMSEYGDAVFDKSLYDAEGMQNYFEGHRLSPEDYEKAQRDARIGDVVGQYTGVINDDMSAEDKLMAVRDHLSSGNEYTRPAADTFSRILDYLNANRNNRMVVNDNIADLETGGQYNVS